MTSVLARFVGPSYEQERSKPMLLDYYRAIDAIQHIGDYPLVKLT
jgi:hypothetical protein